MRIICFVVILLPLGLFSQVTNFQWPLSPVNEQHRISATFDECREDRDHFHNGTDMPLAPGQPALSIMGGLVTGIGSDWIRVEDFAYVHVIPNSALDINDTVLKGAVVGVTDSYAHIHLNYGGGASGHATGNPLLPGKITPFSDPYHPRSPIIQFVKDGTFTSFPGNSLSGRVDIVAQAADTTDLASHIDKNNGIYKIGWALYSADTSTVIAGPYFYFEAKQLYSNSYINNVYAPGSSTSIYRYIVTNKIYTNGYLDCALYDPGDYVISVMSSDTRDNWDTTFVPVFISDEDILPPAPPILNYVGSNGAGGILLEWTAPSDADLAGYRLEFSFDGVKWSSNHGPDVLTAGMTAFTIPSFSENTQLKFRLQAVDNAPIPNHSEYSDSYGVNLNAGGNSILIVDGFDRTNGSWTSAKHDFALSYSDAVVNSGNESSIATASNEWVTNTGNMTNYDAVIWFVGDDSRTDETFNATEQQIITAYLSSGGHFFASGAEIGYDLSAGSASDIAFMEQVLHIKYVDDNSGSLHVDGLGDYFSGLSFNYGVTPYVEDWPDYFSVSNEGEIILKYGNGLTAGVGYHDNTSSTVVLGFTFETIDTDASRSQLMGRVLGYFNGITSIDEIQQPVNASISAIYPNPFNASVNMNYTLQTSGDISISVFDIRGKRVFDQYYPGQGAGSHHWIWSGKNNEGNDLSSGAYIVRINQENGIMLTGKLLLLK